MKLTISDVAPSLNSGIEFARPAYEIPTLYEQAMDRKVSHSMPFEESQDYYPVWATEKANQCWLEKNKAESQSLRTRSGVKQIKAFPKYDW